MSATSSQRLRGAALRERCVELRLAGRGYAEIGHELGVSKQAAWSHVVKALRETATRTAEDAEQLRAIEMARLDRYLARLEYAVSAGDPQAVATALRVAERRAKLCGLDAPTRTHVAGDAGGSPIEVRQVPIDVGRLSDDELETLVALLDRAERPEVRGNGGQS